MKKVFLLVTLGLAVFLCFSSSASATMINEWWGGDRVVRDTVNRLYWYPILTDFLDMNRAEQEAAIENLDYAGSTEWRIATWKETSKMKRSLAMMATEKVMPTSFANLFEPSYEPDRNVSSPWEAWDVPVHQFFTHTGLGPMDFLGYPGYVAHLYNGRTADDAWGWRNPGDGTPAVWALGDADDHFVTHSLLQGSPDAPNLTMLFNFDQHYLPDDVAGFGNAGPVGAWAVTKHVPEPSTMMFLGLGLIGIAAVRRKMKK